MLCVALVVEAQNGRWLHDDARYAIMFHCRRCTLVSLVSIAMLLLLLVVVIDTTAHREPDPEEVVVPEGIVTYQSVKLVFRSKENDTFVHCSPKFDEFDSILVIGKVSGSTTLYLIPRYERAYRCIGKIYCTLFYYIPSEERTSVPVSRVLYAQRFADLPNWTSHAIV